MSRPLRIEFSGAWYHVMNRVAGRRLVFGEPQVTALFLELLADLDSRFGVECHAYCLMGNHYHLLLHTPEGNLGRAMRHFNGVFTQRFNRRVRRDGPLFRGRYHAILVDADHYLLGLSRYIHRNPLEAGLVKQLDRHAASSYPAYVGKTGTPDWLKTQAVLGLMESRTARSRYRRLVEQGGPDEVSEFYKPERHAPVIGSAAFKKQILRGRRAHPEQPAIKHLQRLPTNTEVLSVVSAAWGVPVKALRHTQRGRSQRNLPRAVAMYLCQKAGRNTLGEIAREFGVGHYATVAVTIRRLRDSMHEDQALVRRITDVESKLQNI